MAGEPTPDVSSVPGPLAGVKVVEVAGEASAFAGRLLADLGADVVLVEPPGGHPTRGYGPFAEDQAGPERSLWWWHHQAGKQSVVLDLFAQEAGDTARDTADRGRFRALVAEADVLLESEAPGAVAAALGERPSRLVHLALTPYGQDGPYPPVTDLTVLAAGGPVWSCGYDDHSLPPVRGGGGQGFHTGCHYAVMACLTALLARETTGRGQFVDISLNAAANVTTEFASYTWLVGGQTVQRQTGRHATPRPSAPTQLRCADGRWLNNGTAARRGYEFAALAGWLEQLGLEDEFDEYAVLKMGEEIEVISLADLAEDDLKGEIFSSGRTAIEFLATKLPAYELFTGLQSRGLAAGIIYSPEEVLADPHFVARGFPVEVEHEDLGRSVTYAGGPIRFVATPAHVRRRAPHLGEHTGEVLGP
jgi:benzylsuccinate CoA-transferase BbsE subunit